MNTQPENQVIQRMTRIKYFNIAAWVESFLRDCRSRELSSFTIAYYRSQLAVFVKYCNINDVIEVEQITQWQYL
jgi:site-specific recombinase XerC